MGTLKGHFENDFENLVVRFYSTKMFSKMGLYKWRWKGEKGAGGFIKRHWWFFVVTRNNLSRATTLPGYGMGLSPKFICFSAGSLTLYKGL
jgi:hypothetical protein